MDRFLQDLHRSTTALELHGQACRVEGQFRVRGISLENGQIVLKRLTQSAGGLKLEGGAVVREHIGRQLSVL